MVNTKKASIRATALTIFTLAAPVIAVAASPDSFAIRDYFRLQSMVELAMSSDGRILAYIVSPPSFAHLVSSENAASRERVVLQETEGGRIAGPFAALNGARDLQWIPRTHQLAFLSARSGSVQVYSLDATSGAVQQWTRAEDSVASFRFNTAGDLAYITRHASTRPSLIQELATAERGVLLNPREIYFRNFLPTSLGQAVAMRAQLWLSRQGRATRVNIPGEVEEFFWSSDSKYLSVNFAGSSIKQMTARDQLSSIAIYDTAQDSLKVLLSGSDRDGSTPPVGYLGGEWVPGQHRILARRLNVDQIWLREHFPQWATIATDSAGPRGVSWHEFEDVGARYFPLSPSRFLVRDIKAGIGSLYLVNETDTQVSEMSAHLSGDSTLFTFSADFSRAAFVNESLSRPPEVFIWNKHDGRVTQLTHLNAELSKLRMPRVIPLHWKSRDNVEVSGYLLTPSGPEAGSVAAAGSSSSPNATRTALLTYIHGGPCSVFRDKFASNFAFWPYPLEVLPAYGISVFIPNYRGTCSFGRPFQSPTSGIVEPVDDVATGIEHLVHDGLADPNRLGIAGHSHGGWLAPMVMVKAKRFRVGAFAEGSTNEVMHFELNSEQFNIDVSEMLAGGHSLYSQVQPYLDQSPDLQMQGVHAAVLIENGELTGDSLLMLPLAKAADRLGLPTETVIYPHTDHNIMDPDIQREAATRNLDWMRFWLLDEEDPDPSKAAQYERWRSQRGKLK